VKFVSDPLVGGCAPLRWIASDGGPAEGEAGTVDWGSVVG
jgi:hypothetical protein